MNAFAARSSGKILANSLASFRLAIGAAGQNLVSSPEGEVSGITVTVHSIHLSIGGPDRLSSLGQKF